MPSGVEKHSTMYGSRHILSPQCAFKSLMIHEVLRFALRIAFCCVLHQCKNLDIHCWNLLQWLDKLIIRSTSFKKWAASFKKGWTHSPTSKKWVASSKKDWTHSPTSKKWVASSKKGWTHSPTSRTWVASSENDWKHPPSSKKWAAFSKNGWKHPPSCKKWVAFSKKDWTNDQLSDKLTC